MKNYTEDKKTAIFQIFITLWLSVGSIICYNIMVHPNSKILVCTPLFATAGFDIVFFYFKHFTMQEILFGNIALAIIFVFFGFLTYKSVFKNKEYANTTIIVIMIPDTIVSAFFNIFSVCFTTMTYQNPFIFILSIIFAIMNLVMKVAFIAAVSCK